MKRVLCLALAMAAAVVGLGRAADASFASSTVAAATYGSATLDPPTGPSAAQAVCSIGVTDSALIIWSQPAGNKGGGYEVLRSTTSGSGYTLVDTINSPLTTTYTNTGLPFSTTYYYVVRNIKNAWLSANSTQVSVTTRDALCV